MRLIDSDLLIKILPETWDEDPNRDIKIGTLIAISRTPEVHPIKHARWLGDGDGYICGNCGQGRYDSVAARKFYFCPHCGAQLLD